MDVSNLIRRSKKAHSDALLFRGMYERAYQLVAPNRNEFTSGPGNNKTPRVYDSTGAIATNGFVNNFMNLVTPVYSRWVDLKAGKGLAELALVNSLRAQGLNPSEVPVFDEEIEEVEQALNKQLDKVTENLFAFLNASNLYSELANGYYDAAVGTMALLIMPGSTKNNRGLGSPIHFKAVSPYSLGLEEGAFGEISGIFRTIESRARDIMAEWPEIKNLEFDDKEQMIRMEECTIFDEEKNLWKYALIHNDKLIFESKFTTNPWIIFRYNVIPGEVWGRGPVILAMPDLQQLNAAKELAIKSAQISAYGAYTVISDDVINPNTIRIFPGAMIPVKRNAGTSGPSIQPLPGIGNPNHQLLMENDLSARVRKFLLDDSLPGPQSPKMTATEILERVRNIQKNFGAVFGRISYELLQPIIRRSLDVLINQGLIEMPDEFNKIDSFNLKMQVISPVAKLQSVQDVEALVQTIQTLGGINPELIPQQIKIEELGAWFGNKFGAPTKFFRTEEEQRGLQQQAQEAQLAQQEAQLAQAQGQQEQEFEEEQ